MEAKGFYHERASRVVKTLFPRNENSPQAEVKQRAAVSMSLVRDNKDRWMADIEQRLAVRTAELTAERARKTIVESTNKASAKLADMDACSSGTLSRRRTTRHGPKLQIGMDPEANYNCLKM
uniref:Uncharacterized protein n=1 Tax=Knipowitschia caucasica TaxID=637954 RepID=A0AAV2KME8_KNICA